MQEFMQYSLSMGWFLGNGMFTCKVDDPSEFLLEYSKFDRTGVAGNITCPTLVVDSDNDTGMKGEAPKLYDALTCPKQFMLFTTEEGAGLHCPMAAMLFSHQHI